jgi:hypothetical protein
MAMVTQILQSATQTKSEQMFAHNSDSLEAMREMHVMIAIDVKSMFTATDIKAAMGILMKIKGEGIEALLLLLAWRYGADREAILYLDDGSTYKYRMTAGMNIGDNLSMLVSCLVLRDGQIRTIKGVGFDNVYMEAYVDNVYVSASLGMAIKLVRKLRKKEAGIYEFDDLQVLRQIESLAETPVGLRGDYRDETEQKFRSIVLKVWEDEYRRTKSTDSTAEDVELGWAKEREWIMRSSKSMEAVSTVGVKQLGQWVGIDQYRQESVKTQTEHFQTDVSELTKLGINWLAEVRMVVESLSKKMTNQFRSHPRRLIMKAAAQHDRIILHFIEAKLPPSPQVDLGIDEVVKIKGDRDTMTFMPESLGGGGFPSARHLVESGAYLVTVMGGLKQIKANGRHAEALCRVATEEVQNTTTTLGGDVSMIIKRFYQQRAGEGRKDDDEVQYAVPTTNATITSITNLDLTKAALQEQYWSTRVLVWLRRMKQYTTRGGAKQPGARLWAGIRSRMMVENPMRFILSPFVANSITNAQVQLWLCHFYVIATPNVGGFIGNMCACGRLIADGLHFLGCTGSGNSATHDAAVNSLVDSFSKFGEPGAASRIIHEPRGEDAGYNQGDSKGFDIKVMMLGRVLALDLTGRSASHPSQWPQFLKGKVYKNTMKLKAVEEDPEVDGQGKMNVINAAKRTKQQSKDAQVSEDRGWEYHGLVFLRQGGWHRDLFALLKSFFKNKANDELMAPKYGRTTMIDVVKDNLVRAMVEANWADFQANMRRCQRRIQRSVGLLVRNPKGATMHLESMGRGEAVVSLTLGASGSAGEDEYYDDYDADDVLRYENDGDARFKSHELHHVEARSAKSGRDDIHPHMVSREGYRQQPLYAMAVAMEGVDQGEQDDALKQGEKAERQRRKCIILAMVVTKKALDIVMRNLRAKGDR